MTRMNQETSRRCPECRMMMFEVDRTQECGMTYIWYECSTDSCDGQWLEKIG